MRTTTTLLALLLALPLMSTNAVGASKSSLFKQKDWSFQKNLGQLKDQTGNPLPEIKYYGAFAGVAVYCTNTRLSVVFSKSVSARTNGALKNPKLPSENFLQHRAAISTQRIDMEFEGASPTAILEDDIQEGLINYRDAASPNGGIYGVQTFKKLTYQNIYPNIDLVLLANNTGLEYEFVVRPGGKVSDIHLVRNGATEMVTLQNGGIRYSTAYGTMEESVPTSYEGSNKVASSFVRNGNSLAFRTGSYNKNNVLVIDPGLVWGTYYGGDSDDEAYSLALDGSGNTYLAGVTNSLTGMATKGAYQTTLGGSGHYDGVVAKFSASGKLTWATYFGGDSDDFARSVSLDANGNVYVTGNTSSPQNIATKGAYQTSEAGGADAFLAKFNNNGMLQWATYYGGGGDDIGYGVAVSSKGSVYIHGFTNSPGGIATDGSFQTAYGGGSDDAFIAKFNSAGSLQWGTYFGGDDIDEGVSIALDQSSNLYLTGYSISDNGIATKGAYKSIADANYGDVYVASFDSSGAQRWGTYYGGNTGADIGFSIASDGKSNVYVTGYTECNSGIATTGAYQTSFGGSTDAFLADFSSTGSMNWATYYGGEYDETAYGVACDNAGDVYITGLTSSDTQISTPNGYQPSIANLAGYEPDAFLAKFTSAGAFKYGTYYGGDGYDQGTGIACDNNGDIYIDGLTSSDDFPTNVAYQSTFGGDYDMFVAKFVICTLSTTASGSGSVCLGDNASYLASSHTNSAYAWTVSGGTITDGTGTDSIVVKWNTAGLGSIMEKEVNSLNGCSDSATIKVSVNQVKVPAITGNTTVCPVTATSYHVPALAGASYSWAVSGGNMSSLPGRDSAVVLWQASPGKGYVAVSEQLGSCSAADTLEVTIAADPIAHIKMTDNGKAKYTFASVDSSNAEAGYVWKINGTQYTGYHVNTGFVNTGSHSVSLTVTNSAGCSATLDTTVNITDAGIASFLSQDNSVNIFPNPFADETQVQLHVSQPQHISVAVLNVLGQTIATVCDQTAQPGTYTETIDANALNLNVGVYWVKITMGTNETTQKIIRVKD